MPWSGVTREGRLDRPWRTATRPFRHGRRSPPPTRRFPLPKGSSVSLSLVLLGTIFTVTTIVLVDAVCRTQAVKLIVAAARNTEQSQSNVRSKLYFLGTMVSLNDDKATAALGVRESPRTHYRLCVCVCVFFCCCCAKVQKVWMPRNSTCFCRGSSRFKLLEKLEK